MTTLIEQLQTDVLDRKVRLIDLLRKAKLIAVKLELPTFDSWITAELNGNSVGQTVPDYRTVHGQPMWLNPMRGWLHINFGSAAAGLAKKLSTQTCRQPIGQLEELVAVSGDEFMIPYGPELSAQLSKGMQMEPTQTGLSIPRSSVVGILDAVRTALLQWSLDLQKAGILGEGVAFSPEEKERAQSSSIVYQIETIQNFSGNMGPASGNAIVVGQVSNNEQALELIRSLLPQIRNYRDSMDLRADDKDRFQAEMDALAAEVDLETPSTARIASVLGSIRGILENASGNILAVGILAYVDRILQLLGLR